MMTAVVLPAFHVVCPDCGHVMWAGTYADAASARSVHDNVLHGDGAGGGPG